ncbi:MAG: hypothetical protein LBR48_00195 [Dysgonamonadaceae bacterium]|jgi:chromosome segregation ATPase|nr:hypothetical protein [Dysgonamonadaceae bacterium]
MTDEQKKLLIDLEVRIKQVLYLCDSLREDNLRLSAEIQQKQQTISDTAEELKRVKTKYDNLKMARTITAASVDVDAAKAKLSKMVREVDKCINLLKG